MSTFAVNSTFSKLLHPENAHSSTTIFRPENVTVVKEVQSIKIP